MSYNDYIAILWEPLSIMPIVKKNKKHFLSVLKDEKIRKDIIDAFDHVDVSIFFDNLFENKFYIEEIPIGYNEHSDNFLNLARMIHHLDPNKNERILEVGTGSGFSTAVLSQLCREVYTSEYHEELAITAKERLYSHDFANIRFYAGDATETENPFGEIDKVIVHAACKKRPLNLAVNLKENGTIVYPMGPLFQQQIIHMQNTPNPKTGENFTTNYFNQGKFSPIKEIYGYDTVIVPEIFEDFDDGSDNSNENETEIVDKVSENS